MGPAIRAHVAWIAVEDTDDARGREHRVTKWAARHVEGAVALDVAWDDLRNRVGQVHRFPWERNNRVSAASPGTGTPSPR